MKIALRGRVIVRGQARGEALVSRRPISFFGGVDPQTGVVVERHHELHGQTVSGRVLVFPHGKGSTVGAYVIYALARRGLGPAAILNVESETIIASGCALSGIALVDRVKPNPLEAISTGDWVELHENGSITVRKTSRSPKRLKIPASRRSSYPESRSRRNADSGA